MTETKQRSAVEAAQQVHPTGMNSDNIFGQPSQDITIDASAMMSPEAGTSEQSSRFLVFGLTFYRDHEASYHYGRRASTYIP